MINKFKEGGGSPTVRQKVVVKNNQMKTAKKANVQILQNVYQTDAKVASKR